MNIKLPLVVLLLLCSTVLSAQDFFNIEPFKKKIQTTEEASFDNLLKIEHQGEYNSIEIKDNNNFGREEWDDMPKIDKYYPRRGTRNFVNVYLGLNNFIEDDGLPSSDALYSLNPIASWYGGVNFDNITRLFSIVYLDWGIGVSVQEYAFENTRTRLTKTDDGIEFSEESGITGRKSKMKLWHLNAHFIPTFAFGRYDSFRVGAGVYGGYRLSSSVIYKYDDANGNKQKDKNKGSWYVNQFKYGFRATIGWNFFDLFFNYDMTELFEEDIEAPRLNPVTFGVIF